MNAAGDEPFEREVGFELLVETARLWRSLGHHDAAGRFRIDGVTGPDEYSAVADNNVYTNLMAQRNLEAAARAAERRPELASAHGVDDEETSAWRDAAAAIVIPYDAALGVHSQAEGFTKHQLWNFAGTTPDQYPLLLHFAYFDLYRKQVVKQADLVLAMHWRGDFFTPDQLARNFDYYEQITVRDSSLSACTQAVIAAEVGHLDLAYDYLGEAALVDLDDLEHNTGDGLHIASLAGTWIGVVAGLGGMRDHDGLLRFSPQLPQDLTRLSFRLTCRGQLMLVEVTHKHATYTLLEGSSLEFSHHGDAMTLTAGQPLQKPIPDPPRLERPTQPHGRVPARRGQHGVHQK
jgi:alpha,alpha-trehalose phosphorylase